MNYIKYNKPEDSKERHDQKPLSLDQENQAVVFINSLIQDSGKTPVEMKADIENLQCFVNHYQNLNHYLAYTCGLIATDKKEYEGKEDFFKITF